MSIEDEFTYLPISKQRRYQLRRQRDRRCTMCGEPAIRSSRCLKHLIEERERQRVRQRSRRRYYGTLSYKLQSLAETRSARTVRGRVAIQTPERPAWASKP